MKRREALFNRGITNALEFTSSLFRASSALDPLDEDRLIHFTDDYEQSD